jgi:hypothetical protein
MVYKDKQKQQELQSNLRSLTQGDLHLYPVPAEFIPEEACNLKRV